MNKSILKKLPALLAILVVAGGVQTFTSCSSDDEGGGDGSSSSVGTQNGGGVSSSSLQTQGGGSSSSVGGGSSSSMPSCGEYDPATQYCSSGTIKNYELFVPYGGKTYKAVAVGKQVWLAENLNYAVEDSECYNRLESNCDIYGRLYNWAMAMGFDEICNSTECANQINTPHQGICPDGWHIPNIDEWDVLKRYVESNSVCGGCDAFKLKAMSSWNSNGSASGNGADEYGFSALASGGVVSGSGLRYSYLGSQSLWWSSNEIHGYSAYGWGMSYSLNLSSIQNSRKANPNMYAVRCIKDYSEGDGGGDGSSSSGGGVSSSSLQTQGGGSSSSVAAQGGSLPSCVGVEYDPATKYRFKGTEIKDYEFMPYEGKTYKIVVIGEQTWFAENLNYQATGSKCYDNLESNCDIYGRLYDWATAMSFPSYCNSIACSERIQPIHRGVCPDGWHIPSGEDRDKLYRYVDGTSGTKSPYDSETAGRELKTASGWAHNGNGTDGYGFSALPCGRGYSGGSFRDFGYYGIWWSADESNSDGAYGLSMSYLDGGAYGSNNGKSVLNSVRCIKD